MLEFHTAHRRHCWLNEHIHLDNFKAEVNSDPQICQRQQENRKWKGTVCSLDCSWSKWNLFPEAKIRIHSLLGLEDTWLDLNMIRFRLISSGDDWLLVCDVGTSGWHMRKNTDYSTLKAFVLYSKIFRLSHNHAVTQNILVSSVV